MRDNATVYLTEDEIEDLLKHFRRTNKPEELDDNEVGELLDQFIDELA